MYRTLLASLAAALAILGESDLAAEDKSEFHMDTQPSTAASYDRAHTQALMTFYRDLKKASQLNASNVQIDLDHVLSVALNSTEVRVPPKKIPVDRSQKGTPDIATPAETLRGKGKGGAGNEPDGSSKPGIGLGTEITLGEAFREASRQRSLRITAAVGTERDATDSSLQRGGGKGGSQVGARGGESGARGGSGGASDDLAAGKGAKATERGGKSFDVKPGFAEQVDFNAKAK